MPLIDWINKLLGMTEDEAAALPKKVKVDVVGLKPPEPSTLTDPLGFLTEEPFRYQISLRTDAGLVRDNNEDRGFYWIPADEDAFRHQGCLAIVADGMGGALAGEVASEMAVSIIPKSFYSSTLTPAVALKEALEEANRQIYQAAQKDPNLRGMGTTCVAVALRAKLAYISWIGDSRIYLVRGNGIYALTEDHSVVFELVKQGVLTREQARQHEDRNVLSISMGGRPEVTASYSQQPLELQAGDRIILCSDGLHDLIEEAGILGMVKSAKPEIATQALVDSAKVQGGYDNITVAVIEVLPPQPVSVAEAPKRSSDTTEETLIPVGDAQ
jgi:PPM family protein phosphatase